MASIRTLNLLWERRLRGAYPVSRNALRDDGVLCVAIPRPLEPRAYDLTLLFPDGAAEIRAGFSVETLSKLDVSALSDNGLGMTVDDLYLFHAGEKRRFLGERRLIYIDAALSEDGRHLATIFSDLAAASYALSYGEIDGRVVWMRDMDIPVTAVSLSRRGNRMAVGTESGAVLLIDSARRDVWEFGQSELVRAVACSEDGVWVAYGTALGGVGLLDGHGTRRWEARLPGEVCAVALSADGRMCAALCRPENNPTSSRLFCLEEGGRIGWEFDAEQPLVGLALSANGRYLATATRGGVLTTYEIVMGDMAAADVEGALSDPLGRAAERVEAGDPEAACAILQAALDADPGAVAVYEQLELLRQGNRRANREQAAVLAAQEDYAAAIAVLEAALRDDPMDHDLIGELLAARRIRAEQLLARGRMEQMEGGEAEEALRAAVEADPTLIEARLELRLLRARRVEHADAEAERLLAEGQMEAGVAALERAQALAPTPERRDRMGRVYTAMEFAAGMAAYNAKRYQEALFQFKKALHRDPVHAEAKRYLGFAQRFARDAPNDTLNDRFSRLE